MVGCSAPNDTEPSLAELRWTMGWIAEWQNASVHSRRSNEFLGALCILVSAIGLVGCGSGSADFCSGITSVAGFTTRFSQGLDNFSENQYSQLRIDTEKTRDAVNHVAVQNVDSAEASDLAKKINVFISSMEKVNWDVSLALSDTEAVSAAQSLGTASSLTQANTVESLLIGECGLPSTVVGNDQSRDTLPSPSIPGPTQTDPPTNTISEASQDDALGSTVAALFGLTLSPAQTSCLGAALQGVVDVSSGNANIAQYQGQFQTAFDSCSINFTVPVE